jgi:hypothetical protein
MINKLKILLIALLSPALFLGLAAPSASAYDFFGNACSGQAANSPTCQQASSQTKNNNNPAVDTINSAINIIALATGVGAVIMIIIGGFTMVTSGGNTEAVAAARRRIIFSVVGLVVVALSWTIIRLITDRLIQ